MNKSNKIIAWLMGGAAAIGAALGGGYYASRTAQAPAPAETTQAQSAVTPPAEAPAVEAPKTNEPVVDSDMPEAADAADAAGTPTFDVLRVEKDGSAVVAGSAGPDTKVDLISNGEVIGTAKAGPTGDFAIVLDKPLAPGSYELSLRTTDAAGASVTSQETGIVNLPEGGGELVAMVAKPGEASRVMQAGEPAATDTQVAAVEPAPAADANAPAADASAAPAAEATAPAADATAAPAAEATAPAADTNAPAADTNAPAADSGKPVLLSAVDYEDGKVYVAGTGEPGRAVNIYIDDLLTGTTKVGPDGSYLLEAPTTLIPGTHKIRADQLSADGSQVAERAEVPLVHEAPVAVAENTVKPVEPAATTTEAPAAAATTEAPAAVATTEQPAATTTTTTEAPAATTTEAPAAATTTEAPAATTTEAPAAAATTEQPAATTTTTTEAPAAAATTTTTEAPAATTTITTTTTTSEAPAVATIEEPGVIKTGASVIIRRGDNLWRISKRMLGKGIRYTTIYEANRDQIKNPRLIYPGQVFQVPGGQEPPK